MHLHAAEQGRPTMIVNREGETDEGRSVSLTLYLPLAVSTNLPPSCYTLCNVPMYIGLRLSTFD